ncbi:MAG: ABC transporter permease, partial [Oscillospiraceae bacterium]|nr:ABC transporter permease [Oscillospiraceae bacterium]
MIRIIQTALELGFGYTPVAIALFLSYRILDIADLSTDGCFVLGAAVSVSLAAAGHPLLAIVLAMLCGAAVGCLSAELQTYFGIPSILAGIIVNTGLYTVNLLVMGWRSNVNLIKGESIFTMFQKTGAGAVSDIILLAAGAALPALFLHFFLATRIGLSIRATG